MLMLHCANHLEKSVRTICVGYDNLINFYLANKTFITAKKYESCFLPKLHSCALFRKMHGLHENR